MSPKFMRKDFFLLLGEGAMVSAEGAGDHKR